MYKRYLISGWGAESAKLQARGEGHTLVPWGRARAAIGELPWILRHVIVPRISQSPVPITLGALHLDSNRRTAGHRPTSTTNCSLLPSPGRRGQLQAHGVPRSSKTNKYGSKPS
jgi:hypothetical protein